ncbi:MAG TPA: CheR family methyltransferase, partial [Methanomicrobiales archaeon]|nr:CheR family methyltransferase [Methanomicrobiales archaeon]
TLQEGINASRRDGMIDFQVFATDTDPHAIEIAREGRYLSSIASDVSPERLEEFFVEEGDTFRIHQDIRNSVIFARHDITIDPPFSHLHILDCRLLYVHLTTEIQKDLIPLFAYVLNPGGIFLPGTSETLGEDATAFSVLDRTWHIYQRKAGDLQPILPLDLPRAFSMHKRP